MACRCPNCDQVLLLDGHIDFGDYICCDRCDRGFHPQDAVCLTCGGRNPFALRDGISFACAHCGSEQADAAARMTA